ncbi:hypothetical protein CPLU01_01297 [Colletotrichum plurivorum]|uniref:Uncharacterized protein n=1 Tax=Colletotrichum plurivorum TaxID=2175906 RepID=A0A8H6NPS7_9PEZI|nr:hypothetical protein CPLU01_01297 [Colletotrichum plurivorum]
MEFDFAGRSAWAPGHVGFPLTRARLVSLASGDPGALPARGSGWGRLGPIWRRGTLALDKPSYYMVFTQHHRKFLSKAFCITLYFSAAARLAPRDGKRRASFNDGLAAVDTMYAVPYPSPITRPPQPEKSNGKRRAEMNTGPVASCRNPWPAPDKPPSIERQPAFCRNGGRMNSFALSQRQTSIPRLCDVVAYEQQGETCRVSSYGPLNASIEHRMRANPTAADPGSNLIARGRGISTRAICGEGRDERLKTTGQHKIRASEHRVQGGAGQASKACAADGATGSKMVVAMP